VVTKKKWLGDRTAVVVDQSINQLINQSINQSIEINLYSASYKAWTEALDNEMP